jgi:hypothetical protein
MLLKIADHNMDSHSESEIEIRIDYQKRKKLLIEIDTAGRVKVKAPKGMDEKKIQESVMARAEWIIQSLNQLETALKDNGSKVRDIEKCLYLGKEVPVSSLIEIEGLTEVEIKAALMMFYFKECKRLIQDRLSFYQKAMRQKSKGFEIEDSLKRWGSCRTDGHLTFNYRLAMAPPEVMDYVVVHEVCHLKHMNHDRSFWRLLGSQIGDYKAQIEYLQVNGHEMVL